MNDSTRESCNSFEKYIKDNYEHWICSLCGASGWHKQDLWSSHTCRESLEEHMNCYHDEDWVIHDSGPDSAFRVYIGEHRQDHSTRKVAPEQHELESSRGRKPSIFAKQTGNVPHIAIRSWPDSNDEDGDIPTADMVNHPPHYQSETGLECIDWIEAMLSQEEFKGYLKGQVLRYFWRYEDKWNPVEDLEKGEWYYNELIEREKAAHADDLAKDINSDWSVDDAEIG